MTGFHGARKKQELHRGSVGSRLDELGPVKKKTGNEPSSARHHDKAPVRIMSCAPAIGENWECGRLLYWIVLNPFGNAMAYRLIDPPLCYDRPALNHAGSVTICFVDAVRGS